MEKVEAVGPYTLSVQDEVRTIELKGAGNGTTEDTLRLILAATDRLRELPGYNILYEATQLQISSSSQAMMQVADALFGDKQLKYGRFAVVVPPARESLARIFAALANDNGVVADVFGDVSEARRWLRA